jgi:hypothetical protein
MNEYVERDAGEVMVSRFREVWERLAAEGVCDDIDGMEYKRVFKEWWFSTELDIAKFIASRANIGPT